MSLMFSPGLRNFLGDLPQDFDLIDSNVSDNHHHQQHSNSGLMRYLSAPSTVFDDLVDGVHRHDGAYPPSPGPEMDSMLARFMSTDTDGYRSTATKQEEGLEPELVPPPPPYPTAGPSIGHLQGDRFSSGMARTSVFGSVYSIASQNQKMANGNCSKLIRQSSSPADFATIAIQNGIVVSDRESSHSHSRGLNGQISFARGSVQMPLVAQVEHEHIGARKGNIGGLGNSNDNCLLDFPSESWNDASLRGLKRARHDYDNSFPGLNAKKNQGGNTRNPGLGLTHHLSLPKTFAEMAAAEKFMHFQEAVPCKVRAKRGFATHPRSIAERVRRGRISERMRKLQELFPSMDKQANTSDMLDLAVGYIKDLQKEVQVLTENRAKCTCLIREEEHNNQNCKSSGSHLNCLGQD